MPFFASAGSKVSIGSALATKQTDFVSGDFSSETWAEIKELESIGTFGDTATPVNFTALGDVREKISKGLRSAGTMELVAAIDYADAGQLALIAAEKSGENFAFKVEFNDAPSGGTNSIRYFIGLVMSASEGLDSANNVMKLTSSIVINSNIVRVAAAAGS